MNRTPRDDMFLNQTAPPAQLGVAVGLITLFTVILWLLYIFAVIHCFVLLIQAARQKGIKSTHWALLASVIFLGPFYWIVYYLLRNNLEKP